jgi:hypothetical protein
MLTEGCYITLSSMKVAEKLEIENVSQEENFYFQAKSRKEFKIFTNLTILSYLNGMVEIKFYLMIVMPDTAMGTVLGQGAGGIT